MVRKSYTPEQIINKLREAEILLNQGASVGEASRKIGVTEQTYYRWRKENGGLRVEQARRLKNHIYRYHVEVSEESDKTDMTGSICNV